MNLATKQPKPSPWNEWEMICPCGADMVARDGLLVCMGSIFSGLEHHSWQKAGEEWQLVSLAVASMPACLACDCADPTALEGLASECDCECHGGA